MNRELAYAVTFVILLLSSLLFFNFETLFDQDSPSYFGFLSRIIPKNFHAQPSVAGGCDFSRGRWVWDEAYTSQSYDERCPFLDPGFRCQQNGRQDDGFHKWRWQPEGCDLPRFNASDFLERTRNGRVVFAGDSVGRNHWESLLCMLSIGISNLSNIHEVNGNPISKHKGYLAMRFKEYNMTVEYYRVPFLSVIGRPPPNSAAEVRMTIRVDELHWYSKKWEGADILVFNSGHWWNQDKTIKSGSYFQEGGKVNMTMDVMEAFRRSLETWRSWALNNLDPTKSFIFFRSYAPVHYRNGTWNEGGNCDMETEPEKDPKKLEPDPYYNRVISDVIRQMQYGNWKVQFLNITYLSELRKDGHPSKHREPGTPVDATQDCSHWCLPGVPDTWNQLLYAQLTL
ncbi:protein trichome birefringence-like 8 [Arachis duranensis]|uniref:Protein trichome birefringence-like 8 n=1 Tax=Arachis duranensis TaxID=130453 RepID=A0A6P4CHG7_ARADU|nr:protein trichome birefringence-like 8 [Arachis duranensis]